jgi:TM2 domain-containing membrane protein YozV
MSTNFQSSPQSNLETLFYQQYESARRDEVVGVLLALFLGGFGAHHFYLRRTGLGILYLLFFWTPLPWVFGFIECFFMPARVREFNAAQAAGIAAALGISLPQGWGYTIRPTAPPAGTAPQSAAIATLVACPRCHATNPTGARFCASCGTAL